MQSARYLVEATCVLLTSTPHIIQRGFNKINPFLFYGRRIYL